ncbi:hypothetical protein D3C73_1586080 [compost metagenome]
MIISRYNARCIRCARPVCQAAGLGTMGGVGWLRRMARRNQTSTNTLSPSMKCRSFIRLRSTLSLGNRPRSSIRA